MKLPDTSAKVNKQFYPNMLVLALASHFLYYYTVFSGVYPRVRYLVLLALAALVLGYWCGTRKKTQPAEPSEDGIQSENVPIMRIGALVMIGIGIAAHVYYYWKNPFTSYGEGYATSRGQGYITAFFNFWVLGMMLLEYLSVEGENPPALKWGNRVLMAAYCVLYLAVFLKRRQILLLFIPLLAVWGRKMGRGIKTLCWTGGICAALLMMLYGRARYHMDNSSLAYTIERIAANFTWEWFSPADFEGKYISRTLNDVHEYVRLYGHDTGILRGIFLCMIPRAWFAAGKPMAFPEWYSSHFHPEVYAKGVSFAGSTVGELYLLGGIGLLIVGYVLLGFLCARVQRMFASSRKSRCIMLYALFVCTVVLLPRFDLASLLIETVFLYVPMLLATWLVPMAVSRKKH